LERLGTDKAYLCELLLSAVQSAARGMGPLGPRLVRWMVQKRVSWTPPSNAVRTGELDFELFAKYCYHNWALKASGDIAVHTHLHPVRTTACWLTVRRRSVLTRSLLPQGAAARGTPLSAILVPEKWALPVTFIYGGGPDWMPKEHGEAVVETLQTAGRYATFRVVPLSGHQVFMDNASAFDRVLIAAVDDWGAACVDKARASHGAGLAS